MLEQHDEPSRDGLYVDPTFTPTAAAGAHVDMSFTAVISGPTYAQPLYLARAGGRSSDLVIAATETNQVTAFAAASGAIVWQKTLAPPVPLAALPCGNINPMGITGTPVIDPLDGTIYLDALTTPDSGTTVAHLVFALAAADGAIRPGWPLDVGATVKAGGVAFDPHVQGQRGALALLGKILYVPYGGFYGDCGTYHGWVVGIPLTNPAAPIGWRTPAVAGGIWAPGGLASDGTSIFAATGNTMGVTSWSGGEAILRFAPGPVFSGSSSDYFTPANWQALDAGDIDLGGSGPLLIDVAGGNPPHLIIALGKDGKAYLLDRSNLGGVGGEIAKLQVSTGEIIQAATAYPTAQGMVVVFQGPGAACTSGSGGLTSFLVTATAPPKIVPGWCADAGGKGSPIVTTTDGQENPIVWAVGAEGDNRLHGFDGLTGATLFAGGGTGDQMSTVRRFETPIVVSGRLFVAADDQVYAFTLK